MPQSQRPVAFTLIELLVVVSIIVVLLALLTPALDKAMEQTIRVICQSNTRIWSQVSIQYAMDESRSLPIGRPEGVDSRLNPYKTDHMGQFRYETWRIFADRYKLPEESGICRSLGREPAYFLPYNGGGLADPDDNGVFSTFIGFSYWANRKPPPDPQFTFRFPTRINKSSTSPTLVTCKAYDESVTGARWQSYAPHVGGEGLIIPKGGAYEPKPDGIAVGNVDGSDHWVAFEDLQELRFGSMFYYDGPAPTAP